MIRSISNKLGLIALLVLSSPIYAQDGLENLMSLNEYVNALKTQITTMEKGAAGTEDDVYLSPIKVKLQAAVKKKVGGGVEFYVLTLDGAYEQTLTQIWEFEVSNKPTNGGFRANYEVPAEVLNWGKANAKLVDAGSGVIQPQIMMSGFSKENLARFEALHGIEIEIVDIETLPDGGGTFTWQVKNNDD